MKRQAVEAVDSAVAGLNPDLARAEGDRQHFVNSLAEAMSKVSSLRYQYEDYAEWEHEEERLMMLNTISGQKTIPATAMQRESETLTTSRGSKERRLR